MVHLFDPKKIKHLESPERAEWQKPSEIIKAVKVREGDIIVDFGAGTGYFAVLLAGACLPGGKVIAVDIQQELIDYLEQRVVREKISNISVVKGNGWSIGLPSESVDLIFTANTFHELKDRAKVITEFKRVLKKDGRLVVLDWATVESPVGPPIAERLSFADAVGIVETMGLKLARKHTICSYHYVLEFVNEDISKIIDKT